MIAPRGKPVGAAGSRIMIWADHMLVFVGRIMNSKWVTSQSLSAGDFRKAKCFQYSICNEWAFSDPEIGLNYNGEDCKTWAMLMTEIEKHFQELGAAPPAVAGTGPALLESLSSVCPSADRSSKSETTISEELRHSPPPVPLGPFGSQANLVSEPIPAMTSMSR